MDIILLIAIPSVTKVIEKSRNDTYKRTVDGILRAADLYVAKKAGNLPGLNDVGDTTEILLQTLIDNKLLSSNLYDNVNKIDISTNSIVVVSIDDTEKYIYKFVEGEYVTSGLKLYLDGIDKPQYISNKWYWVDRTTNGYNAEMVSFTNPSNSTTDGYNNNDNGYVFDGNSYMNIANPISEQSPSTQSWAVEAVVKVNSSP